MFLIRRIHDDVLPVNKEAIRQVREIFREQFTEVFSKEIAELAEKLDNPFKQQFRSVLLVAERQREGVIGFAFYMFEPVLRFCYLDFIASRKNIAGRGVGAALYHHLRKEAISLGSKGLFFECRVDDPKLCNDPELLSENAARLKFYERFGALPVDGTDFQLPIDENDRWMTYLMYDPLEADRPLRRDFARKIVRAILERKYGDWCPRDYVERVIASFRDDPLKLREPRYVRHAVAPKMPKVLDADKIMMVVNDKHDIHHVRERGYVEAPVRIRSIERELEQTGIFHMISARRFPQRHILAVHDRRFVKYLHRTCREVAPGKSIYPYVFPVRNITRPPKELTVRAGYYCLDTFTPLSSNAYLAARGAVDCTLTCADEILRGRPMAYALVRPPGHHAETGSFGGFCYFNNAAIAAEYLTDYGRVAIVDLDYHHGNGQEEIFYQRDDVLTVSIHAHPNIAYPHFSGFANDRGDGKGKGFNLNLPLPEIVRGEDYRKALGKAIKTVVRYNPDFLIIALGLDTAKGDPTGSWLLDAKDFEQNGRQLGRLDLPTLVVQEGGYRTRTLGINARHFFTGLVAGAAETRSKQ